jgi:hypothetical protein
MPMVNLSTAVAITGRSPMTLRAAIRSGALAYAEGRWHGGRKGEPGRVVWIDAETSARGMRRTAGRADGTPAPSPPTPVESLRASWRWSARSWGGSARSRHNKRHGR